MARVADSKLYDLLGVSPDASENEIRKQYKKLARHLHPDKNPDPEAAEKFKELTLAHEVLTDPEKRSLYDRFGEDGLRNGGGMGGGMDDLFSHIFGGGGGGGIFGGFGGMGFPGMGGGRRRAQRRRGEDTVHKLKVTLEDLYNGKSSKLKLKKNVICASCKGIGGKDGAVQKCSTCRGSGVKISIQAVGPGMVQQVQRVCPDCSGNGETIDPKHRCKKCNGKKVNEESKILEVNVEKGMKDNQKIFFHGEGDQQPNVEPGDVIIVLFQAEHDSFKRSGDDLHMKLKIGLTEALCGFQIPIKHLDGRELLVTSAAGIVIHPGSTRTIVGEGMPMHRNPFEKGNLFITFDVEFPENGWLSEAQLEALATLLPKAPAPPNTSKANNLEDVLLMDYDKMGASEDSGRREAYDADEDDDAMGGHGPGVQCATS